MPDKYANDISYWVSISAIGGVVLLTLLTQAGFEVQPLAGVFFLISPVIGLTLLVTGIVGLRTGGNKRKAILGITTGTVFILIFTISLFNIIFWLENMKGAFPVN